MTAVAQGRLPVYAIGRSARPTEAEWSALGTIQARPGEVRAIYLLDNRRVRSGGPVSGAVYEFDPKAIIREGSPLLSESQRLFGCIMTARIVDPSVDETAARAAMQTLAESIAVDSPMPYSLAQNVAKAADPIDAAPWVASLGRRAHFVGLHKEEHERSMPVYRLVVHADSGDVGRELVDRFVRPRLGALTYEQLVDSVEYARARLYSRRNAKRLLATAADHLGLRILRTDDVWARLGAYEAPPDLAVPTTEIEFNLLQPLLRPFGRSIAFYSRSMPLSTAEGGAVPHLVDPAYGLELYSGDSSVSLVGTCPWSNIACSSFPVGTGRTVAAAADAERRREQLARSASDRRFLASVMTWKGRRSSDEVAAHPLLHCYADLAVERRRMHAEQLGARHGRVRLRPVVVVLAPPACGQIKSLGTLQARMATSGGGEKSQEKQLRTISRAPYDVITTEFTGIFSGVM